MLLLPLYADDTEIYKSSKHGDKLVANLNCDLENVRKLMLKNRLQIHPICTLDLPTIKQNLKLPY